MRAGHPTAIRSQGALPAFFALMRTFKEDAKPKRKRRRKGRK